MKTRYHCLLTLAALALSTISYAGALIDEVHLVNDSALDLPISKEQASAVIDNEGKKNYTFSWTLNQPGKITVLLCDLSGNIVSTFQNNVETKVGTQSFSWDGTDDAGNQCPSGLYFPVIRVKSAKRGVENYNPTSLPWGEEIIPENMEYDSSSGVIRYTLGQAAYCRLRVGESDGGPLYKTVTDWQYKSAGVHEEEWDGMDISGIVKAYEKEKFRIAIDAFSLPANTIVIPLESRSTTSAKDIAEYKKMTIYPPSGKRIAFYPTLPNGLLADLEITFNLPSSFAKKEGYRLHGQVPVKVDLSKGIVRESSDEVIEALLYVDGKLIGEQRMTSFPAEVKLDTGKSSNGFHILTVNVRTSGDRAASASTRIFIAN